MSSTPVGYNEYGYLQFETKRSEIGDLLYRLKYKGDQSVIHELVETAAGFIETWGPRCDAIVTVPPHRVRAVQPLWVLGHALADRLKMEYGQDWVWLKKEVAEIKNVHDFDDRSRLLEQAHVVDRAKVEGRKILLVDDLYRSGATMNSVAAALLDDGAATKICALALTYTRTRA